MALNKPSYYFFLTVFILNCLYSGAQETEEEIVPGFFIDPLSPSPRIYHRIVWDPPDENAYDYEIIIQNINDSFDEYFRERTENFYIELSISPGSYRYSITAFDYLGRSGDTSDWIEFTVLPAYQPQIESFAPSSIFMDLRTERILDLSVINLLEDSIIIIKNDENELIPIRILMGRNRARLFFNDEKLVQGVYNIYIVNPGGLETRKGGLLVGYRKPMDIFYKLAWNPVIPIYGIMKDEYNSSFHFSGISFGFEIISSKRSSFNGGLELYASTYYLSPATKFEFNYDAIRNNFQNNYSAVSLSDFGINIALQKRFYYMMHAVTFRFGLGLSSLNGFGTLQGSEMPVHMNIGVTGLFLLYEIFHLEIGLNYTHYMAGDAFGLLKPKVGFVWKY